MNNYQKNMLVLIIALCSFTFIIYQILRLFALIPHFIDGADSQHSSMQKITGDYYLDLRDSTLWKNNHEVDAYMLLISEKVNGLSYNTRFITGKTKGTFFVIYFQTDSVYYSSKPIQLDSLR